VLEQDYLVKISHFLLIRYVSYLERDYIPFKANMLCGIWEKWTKWASVFVAFV